MDAWRQADVMLKDCLGPDAEFRDGQWEAIEAVAVRHERVLVVQRTGWGKSLVYFFGTRLLRERGAGPTLIVSPLLALMRDQLRMAERLGLRAAALNSANADEWQEIEARLGRDELDLLLVSPERLGNDRFMQQALPSMRKGVGLLVVDEAHCISDWGHDFRPDYRRIVGILRQLPAGMPVLATTATANDRVIDDVGKQLGPSSVLRGPLMRDSLRLQTIRLETHAERLAWLAQHVPTLRKAGIIYVQTVNDALQVSSWLELQGLKAPAYFGAVGSEARLHIEAALLENRLDAVVATTALGMGFDKPDLGFVIHYQRPGSVIAYYQQIGRAGRAIPEAYAILLHGHGDDDIQDYFIESAFPTEEVFRGILDRLDGVESLTKSGFGSSVNASYGRIEQALKMLELDGAVSREGSRYSRTINPWRPDRERITGVTAQRRHELHRMREFTSTGDCLMHFIARELDDATAAPCGVCANCAGKLLSGEPDPGLTGQALSFLQLAEHPIRPRKLLPAGVYPDRASRMLDPSSRLEQGRALAVWGDSVWGDRIRAGKYETERFDDALVDAAARLIRERWQPEPPPTWVTAVPSLRRPALVPDFAQRLAAALALPYLEALGRRRESAEQKTMQNSAQQLLNVVDAIAVRRDRVQPGPVLLVDDIVDSGWTLASCGARLRRAGACMVYPFALAAMPPGKNPE